MAEQFGRANSTRWTTEVPDYDDWGHEYDDEVQQLAEVAEELEDNHLETASEPEVESTTEVAKTSVQPPLNPLVLSIDQPSDDDDLEFDDSPTYSQPSKSQSKSQSKKQTRPPPPAPPTISISGPEEAPPMKPAPPPPPPAPKMTKVPSTPKVAAVAEGEDADNETGYDSYDSDDLIQVEHSLNVASPNKRKSLLIDPNKLEDNILDDIPESPIKARDTEPVAPVAPIGPPPIPMFVINHDYDKDLPTDDSWGTPRETPPTDEVKHPVPNQIEEEDEEEQPPSQDVHPSIADDTTKQSSQFSTIKEVDATPQPPVVSAEPVNRKLTKRKAPTGPKPLDEPEFNVDDHVSSSSPPTNHHPNEPITASTNTTKPAEPAPLVLSIDNDVLDSLDDNWGHNSDSSSDGDIDEPTPYTSRGRVSDSDSNHSDPTPDLNITKLSLNHTPVASPRQPVDTTMLDDLMHDIENVSYGEPEDAPTESEPPRKPLGAKELPEIDTGDFTLSFARYMDQEWLENPITPLSPAQLILMHQDFVRSVSDRRLLVRKPPTPRAALVSMDYSHIADAVSNYMDDDLKTIDLSKRSERLRDDVLLVAEEALVFLLEASFTKNDDRNGFPPPPPPKIDVDMSSRRSLAQTLGGFGQWKPNTLTFRDQFINDQADLDSESNTIIESNYLKFTQPRLRVVLEVPLLPETIDVAMPRIDEDDDNLSSSDSSSRRILVDTVGSSVLAPPTSQPVFHEEKLTPNPLMEEVHDKQDHHHHHQGQRYSSLLDGIEDKPKVPEKQRYLSLLGNDGRDRLVLNATDKLVDTIVATPASGPPSNLQEVNLLEPTAAADTSGEHEDNDGNNGEEDDLVKSESQPTSLALLTHPSQPHEPTTATTADPSTVKFTPKRYPVLDWKLIVLTGQPVDKIANLKAAIEAETNYDTGLRLWLEVVVKQQKEEPQMTNGRIATEAYQNATHLDIRRHNSINTKQIIGDVKDNLVNAAPAARSFGKKFFNKSKSLMKKAN